MDVDRDIDLDVDMEHGCTPTKHGNCCRHDLGSCYCMHISEISIYRPLQTARAEVTGCFYVSNISSQIC